MNVRFFCKWIDRLELSKSIETPPNRPLQAHLARCDILLEVTDPINRILSLHPLPFFFSYTFEPTSRRLEVSPGSSVIVSF